MKITTIIFMILLSGINIFAGDPVVIDTTGLDFQNYWYTGTFGQQIVVDSIGNVHVCYNKTWCTESDTGWQVMYAKVTEGKKIRIPSQLPEKTVQPAVVYMDGGHKGAPIIFYYGVGNKFYIWDKYAMHYMSWAKLSKDGENIIPLGYFYAKDYCGGCTLDYYNPIAIEADNLNGIVHCIYTYASGKDVAYINLSEPNIGEPIQMLFIDPNSDIQGKDVPWKYRRNATKGADLAVSFDGSEVTVATLHPACNILLHKGYYAGEIWEDDFYDGLANGSVIALFDTSDSEFGTNIPNNDPKPYTNVHVSYDENDNLHVVYDATYFDVWLDTSRTVPWGNWWATYSSMAGDTNGVFYNGSEHPKVQLRYWNSITKTHTLLAECEYPQPGETYKWYNYGIYDSSAGSWGKYINDGLISNVEFFVNKDQKPGEPKLVCVWEEMQGEVTALYDAENEFNYTYYAYMKDIKISVSNDGSSWSAPFNITNSPDLDEGEVSVYRDVIDNKIHLVYSQDGLPGSDSNLSYVDDYEDKYLHDWPPIDGHRSVPIRKETTEQVKIIYREFDLSELPTNIRSEKYLPGEFELAQNYPNPFNPTTTIAFSVPITEKVKISVYNIQGRLVEILLDKTVIAGQHQIIWNANHLSSGVYIYRIETDGFNKTRKCLLVK